MNRRQIIAVLAAAAASPAVASVSRPLVTDTDKMLRAAKGLPTLEFIPTKMIDWWTRWTWDELQNIANRYRSGTMRDGLGKTRGRAGYKPQSKQTMVLDEFNNLLWVIDHDTGFVYRKGPNRLPIPCSPSKSL